jgi:hypothetical protein
VDRIQKWCSGSESPVINKTIMCFLTTLHQLDAIINGISLQIRSIFYVHLCRVNINEFRFTT